MDELKISVSKLDISEKLIEGYVKVPPSLKEQTITSLAIRFCPNDKLKKDIFRREQLSETYASWLKWDMSIDQILTYVCQNLPLPCALKKLLAVSIRTIDLQMNAWSMQQGMFELSFMFAKSLLSPSDWVVVEMRLDEEKIAKRLVQYERIPLVQRFRMACFHCLESFILSLWNQISHEGREDIFQGGRNKVVYQWVLHLSGELKEMIDRPYESTFWRHLFKRGVSEGSLPTVLQSWGKLNERIRQEVLITTAEKAVRDGNFTKSFSDILCFLLTRMSKEQRILFFQTAFQNTEYCVLECFLRWPYLDLLLPIIKELWAILPVFQYYILLSSLTSSYSNKMYFVNKRNDYLDYDYGYLIIDILEETPDPFKRYVFNDNYYTVENYFVCDTLLYYMLRTAARDIQHREIFERIWQHVSLEERRSFLRSSDGSSFCNDLTVYGECELLTSILGECLPEDELLIFKKKYLDTI